MAHNTEARRTLRIDPVDRGNANTPGLAMARARKLEVTSAYVQQQLVARWLSQ